MATANDPFILNTDLAWDGNGRLIDQLKGKFLLPERVYGWVYAISYLCAIEIK